MCTCSRSSSCHVFWLLRGFDTVVTPSSNLQSYEVAATSIHDAHVIFLALALVAKASLRRIEKKLVARWWA